VHGIIEKISAQLIRLSRWAVFVILLYLVLAINATIVLRAIFGISLPWIMDSAVLVAPYLAFFAAAIAFGADTHPKMEFLFQKMQPRLRYIVRVFIHGFTVALFAILCYHGWGYAQMGKSITITSMDFLTLYPFYFSLPIGFGIIAVISTERLLNALIHQRPDIHTEEEL